MIKPADVMARMPHAEAVAALEKKVDASINYAVLMSKWPVTLALRGEQTAIVEEVLKMYRLVGWNIKRVADSREGDFIQIEAP